MLAVIALVAAVALTLLVTRVGAIALTLTGLSDELARFQSRSAFTGTGFTTSEAEKILNHPVRRRIVMLLMLLGNAGIVTLVATLVITFSQSGGPGAWLVRSAVIGGGFVALWFLTWNRLVDRALSSAIAWGLKTWTDVDARDYAHLLHLSEEYGVAELSVGPDDWLAGRTLAEARPRAEGVLVLGVQREDGTYLGAPNGATKIAPGDVLTLYARDKTLADLDQRRRTSEGDLARERSEREQRKLQEAQSELDTLS